ncbi:MBOAT family protein [Lewinella sp. 4G2]|uniref:MBOAT family O-acyltransferase n=1 Tax=Lewinella sp. 4G2 TaxID=1803372 RepID=UPI0007B4BE75|nr:MBOAT family O-acyltransferase [Lewinella sp. 4G2]OAV44837.1 acyltransferase [Lewinella sp. 4G2]
MSFNTLEFAVFFAVFFVLYWFVTNKHLRVQNALIVVASYIFYGWWDERFLALIAISSAADYAIGLQMGKSENDQVRLRYLWLSLAINLGILGFFKYFNFFLDNLNGVSSLLGMRLDWPMLNIILPVGISFYTLQTLSYTFDVYKRKIEPTRDAIAFFAYVSFFPQLVAGPIERATQLLPQFHRTRKFDYAGAADGARQVVWGLFMKMVIADNIGPYVDANYFNPTDFNQQTIWIMAYLGVVQMYCDFAGYSNIAIGLARILGFDLMKNFDYPLFARNISEFWQKWHISLITWLRDYVIVWLKGMSKWKVARNIFVIFFVAGLWHGADWRYIIWGVGNALWFIPLLIGKRKKYRKPVAHGRILPTFSELLAMFWVVTQFTLVGMMFRGFSLSSSMGVYKQAVNFSAMGVPVIPDWRFVFVIVLFGVEWWQREQDHGMDFTKRNLPGWARWAFYFVVIFLTLFYGGQANDFIYFQF